MCEVKLIPTLFTLTQFVKDYGRLVDEKKLRVVLLSSPSSPVNGDFKLDPTTQMPPSLTVSFFTTFIRV